MNSFLCVLLPAQLPAIILSGVLLETTLLISGGICSFFCLGAGTGILVVT
jgi:hypothetical protein